MPSFCYAPLTGSPFAQISLNFHMVYACLYCLSNVFMCVSKCIYMHSTSQFSHAFQKIICPTEQYKLQVQLLFVLRSIIRAQMVRQLQKRAYQFTC